jgi:prevent-host-death family protein
MMIRMERMINIRPVSDLRYKFTEIENDVKRGAPVYLTKNGYGSMVVMSIEAYSKLVDYTEDALDEADHFAETNSRRMSHGEVFTALRKQLND